LLLFIPKRRLFKLFLDLDKYYTPYNRIFKSL
jgi:hypothetical protein